MTTTLLERTVPIPNALFDEALPDLSDTELRVLLVVLRGTFGWRETAPDGTIRFKERDWITHRLFAKRTGRSSTAITGAIQSLVDKELIKVEDWRGIALHTADIRRRTIGRQYFRPGDKWITPRSPYIRKVNTTKESRYKTYKRTLRNSDRRFTKVSEVIGSQQTLYDERYQ